METALTQKIKEWTQYNTSSACLMSRDTFLALVQPHLPPGEPLPQTNPLPHVILEPADHFPLPEVDKWILLARDPALAQEERRLAQYLPIVTLEGTGYDPTTTPLAALTDHTVDRLLDQGMFGTALVVHDSLLEVREPVLRDRLRERAAVRFPTWIVGVREGFVRHVPIVGLTQVGKLSPHVNDLVLDLAHLWGTASHGIWVRLARSRPLTVHAMGWLFVPPMEPGWGLNDDHPVSQGILTAMLARITAPCIQTKDQLVKLDVKMGLQQRATYILARGEAGSMEWLKVRKWCGQVGPHTHPLSLLDLPRTLLAEENARRGIRPILVLPSPMGAALSLGQWMLLLAHMGTAVLVLWLAPSRQEQAALIHPPLDQCATWVQKQPIKTPTLTRKIVCKNPWIDERMNFIL